MGHTVARPVLLDDLDIVHVANGLAQLPKSVLQLGGVTMGRKAADKNRSTVDLISGKKVLVVVSSDVVPSKSLLIVRNDAEESVMLERLFHPESAGPQRSSRWYG